MVDILDAAQNNTQTPPSPPPVEPPPAPLMPPVDDIPTPPPPPPSTPMGSDDLVVPPLPAQETVKEEQNTSAMPEEIKPPEPPKEDKPKKKRMSPAMIITGIILLLITVPLAGLVIKNSTEIRSQAGKINTAKAQKAIVKLGSAKAQKEYADASDKSQTAIGQYLADNPNDPAAQAEKARLNAISPGAGDFISAAGASTNNSTSNSNTTLPDTSTCAGTSGEGAIACQKNPPISVTETTDPATGVKTRTTIGYPVNGDGTANTSATKYTLITKTDSSGNVVAQTLNGRDLIAINNSYANPNVGKICNRGAVGSNDRGAAVSSCGDGAACLNNLCVAVGAPCVKDSNTSTDSCGPGSQCVGTLNIEGPKAGVATIPGGCMPTSPTTCAECTGADNSASECAALCNVQRPTITTAVTPPGGGGGTSSGGGGGGDNGGGAPQCVSIVAYDSNGNALSSTDLAALHPGDTVTFGYAPGGSATKVRFQVNSGSWNETTSRNPNNNAQFTWTYTLDNTTNFSIAAQWFDGTNWNQ